MKLYENDLFEMAHLHPVDTGLSTTLYATYNGQASSKFDSPRVILLMQGSPEPITIGDVTDLVHKDKSFNEADQNKIDEAKKYIELHKRTFIDHWNGLITDKGLAEELYDGKLVKRMTPEERDKYK